MELGTARQVETPLPAKTSRMAKVAAWTLSIFLALLFVFAGGVKFFNNPVMVQEFAQVGLGQWFRYFTGSFEVAGACFVLIPRFRLLGALLISLVMVGATIANLTVLHQPPAAILTVILLALTLVLAWLARPRRLT
jgi:putative oxidoreductase